MVKKGLLMVGAAVSLCLGGVAAIRACGDEKPLVVPVGMAKPQEPAKASEAPMVQPAVVLKDGTIAGTVKIKGVTKKRGKIAMTADPKCAALHAETLYKDDIVVDPSGNVQWAFVYVKNGAEGKGVKPTAPALLDQKGCRYEPHVLGIMVGQDLLIRNSDDMLHNIHPGPFANKEFNISQATKGQEDKKQFTTHEVMVKVKCDVHSWMSAWVGVLEHPFFGVTDGAGKYEIKGLPDGKYTIEVWHEGYKSVSKEVDLKGGLAVDFELSEKKGN